MLPAHTSPCCSGGQLKVERGELEGFTVKDCSPAGKLVPAVPKVVAVPSVPIAFRVSSALTKPSLQTPAVPSVPQYSQRYQHLQCPEVPSLPRFISVPTAYQRIIIVPHNTETAGKLFPYAMQLETQVQTCTHPYMHALCWGEWTGASYTNPFSVQL